MLRIYFLRICLLAIGLICSCPIALADASLSGSSLVMKSNGSATMGSTATDYVATYLMVPNEVDGGAYLDFTVNANSGPGLGNPHMNLVIADTKLGIDVTSTSSTNYGFNDVFLPAGTYVVRVERDYIDPTIRSSRSVSVNNLAVSGSAGATFSNPVSTDTAALNSNALTAANTYINNFRRGAVTIDIVGATPGTQVEVDLVRHAFNFGTAVPSNINSYLGGPSTAQQIQYQQRLNQNFNALVAENAGKWSSNENTRDTNPTTGMAEHDQMLDYAQAHNMRARAHNLIWGNQQPNWVNTMKGTSTRNNTDTYNATTNPQGTNLVNKEALYSPTGVVAPGGTPNAGEPSELAERIGYYVGDGNINTPGDRASKYVAIDVYNESFHTGASANNNYWGLHSPTLDGAQVVAQIYRDVRDRIAADGNTALAFVNEYNTLNDMGADGYSNWYADHILEIRDAGFNSGYGDVIGGIGLQYYVNPFDGDPGSISQGEHYPQRMMQALQNLSAAGLPLTLTEFGGKSTLPLADAPQVLEESLRMIFGNANADGFFMWDFVIRNGGAGQFAPNAGLYSVNTSNWNGITITDAGRVWEELMGVGEYGLFPEDEEWHTEYTGGNALTADSNGEVAFDGFYGDYVVTINGEDYPITITKGQTNYSIVLPGGALGDLNDDGSVDDQDVDILWNVIRPELAGDDDPGANDDEDLNGDGFVNEDDVDYMLANLLDAGTNRQYGDADLDGGVGGLDYTAWRQRAGTGWANGDFDGDGGVGGLDYTLWRTRPTAYPSEVGPHAGALQGVPEPATIVLMAIGLSVLALARRSRP